MKIDRNNFYFNKTIQVTKNAGKLSLVVSAIATSTLFIPGGQSFFPISVPVAIATAALGVILISAAALMALKMRPHSNQSIISEKAKEVRSILNKRLLVAKDLPAIESVIEKEVPEYRILLKMLSEEDPIKAELQQIVNKAIVVQTIKNTVKFYPDEAEKALFSSLGLSYDKLEGVLLRDQLSGEVDELIDANPREYIERRILASKLVFLGSDLKDIDLAYEKLKLLKSFQAKLELGIKQVVKDGSEALNNEETWRDRPALIHRSLRYIQIEGKTGLKSIITKAAKMSSDDLKNYISNYKIDSFMNKLRDVSLKKIEKFTTWHQKWAIAKELIQGQEDSSECLGNGVCFANCLRLMELEMKHPEIELDELIKHVKLTREDRFKQALYSRIGNTGFLYLKKYEEKKFIYKIVVLNQSMVDLMVKNLKANEWNDVTDSFSVDNKILFKFDPITHKYAFAIKNKDNPNEYERQEDFISNFNEYLKLNSKEINLNELPDNINNHGVFYIHLNILEDAHAMYLRIDKKRALYRFFDSNLGLTQNFESIEKLQESLNEHFRLMYHHLDFISIAEFASLDAKVS